MSKLMLHVVAGYPDKARCLSLMKEMDSLGVSAVEVQVPFSDPIADGEAIMRANDEALAGGMTTADTFALVNEAGLNCDTYIMSYLQKVQHFGLQAFCRAATDSGAEGLIIPDLPYDSPDYVELEKCLGSLELVPVLSPGMPEERLATILKRKPATVYVTSQRGITGNTYSGNEELDALVKTIRQQSQATVMVGFGITTPQDVKDALAIGDVAVVGSAIIKKLQAGTQEEALGHIRTLVEAA